MGTVIVKDQDKREKIVRDVCDLLKKLIELIKNYENIEEIQILFNETLKKEFEDFVVRDIIEFFYYIEYYTETDPNIIKNVNEIKYKKIKDHKYLIFLDNKLNLVLDVVSEDIFCLFYKGENLFYLLYSKTFEKIKKILDLLFNFNPEFPLFLGFMNTIDKRIEKYEMNLDEEPKEKNLVSKREKTIESFKTMMLETFGKEVKSGTILREDIINKDNIQKVFGKLFGEPIRIEYNQGVLKIYKSAEMSFLESDGVLQISINIEHGKYSKNGKSDSCLLTENKEPFYNIFVSFFFSIEDHNLIKVEINAYYENVHERLELLF